MIFAEPAAKTGNLQGKRKTAMFMLYTMVWRGLASVSSWVFPVPRGGTVVCPTLFLRVVSE